MSRAASAAPAQTTALAPIPTASAAAPSSSAGDQSIEAGPFDCMFVMRAGSDIDVAFHATPLHRDATVHATALFSATPDATVNATAPSCATADATVHATAPAGRQASPRSRRQSRIQQQPAFTVCPLTHAQEDHQ